MPDKNKFDVLREIKYTIPGLAYTATFRAGL